MKILEIIVLPRPRNKKEFTQTLENLTEKLNKHCSTLKIDEFEDGLKFSILVQWETVEQMHNALRSGEFTILTGAISALCEKTVIRFDGKQLDINISELRSLRSGELIKAISKHV